MQLNLMLTCTECCRCDLCGSVPLRLHSGHNLPLTLIDIHSAQLHLAKEVAIVTSPIILINLIIGFCTILP